MDFRRLHGASFSLWKYFCTICKKREGGITNLENRFLRGGNAVAVEIAKELEYNPQTVTQAIHTLKEAGFLTEVRDPIDNRKCAYFLHVILMGEYVKMPAKAEKIARRLFHQQDLKYDDSMYAQKVAAREESAAS